MKKFKIYEVITEDYNDTYKFYIPAENKKDAENYVSGNGEIVRTKESELYGVNSISLDKVIDALQRYGFGQAEQDIISRILQRSSDVVG